MNITRAEQRILHLLAQGGWIELERDDDGRIEVVHCHTRDNWRFSGFDLDLFRRLKRRRAVASRGGGPYRITRRGLELVRARLDNR
ncbi:YjhX family toxin [Mesorhizobium sp. CAU 1732]|uniref:YjhX family toxin n=1 Tax=Mesorhizobium sp. CAU 1732 TaxID=3140358 RepID=UPI00325FE17C